MQNADRTGRQGCGVTSGADAVTCRLVSVETDVGIIEEVVEDADGVGATADAGDDCVGQPTPIQALLARLPADDPVELADHLGERCRPGDGAEQVVRRGDVGDPVAHRLVDRVLSVRLPVVTGTTLAPSNCMRATFGDCRCVSSSPM